jgi:3-oxoadipate enol-lactonase
LNNSISLQVRGSGLPLVLVHGFALDHRMWQYQIDALSTHFRVIAVDVPGCGASPSQGARSVADLAKQLFVSIEPLLDNRAATYIGLSMGGYIGWEMLSQFPHAFHAAVMCDTRASADLPTTAEGRRQMARKVFEESTEALLSPMIPRLLCDQTLASQPQVVQLMKEMMFTAAPQTIHDHQIAMSERQDFQDRLPNFHIPILAICGEDDILTPPKEMKRMAGLLPKGSFVEIEQAGHMAPLEQPLVVNQYILNFLRAL